MQRTRAERERVCGGSALCCVRAQRGEGCGDWISEDNTHTVSPNSWAARFQAARRGWGAHRRRGRGLITHGHGLRRRGSCDGTRIIHRLTLREEAKRPYRSSQRRLSAAEDDVSERHLLLLALSATDGYRT